jgi:hypothetical protein
MPEANLPICLKAGLGAGPVWQRHNAAHPGRAYLGAGQSGTQCFSFTIDDNVEDIILYNNAHGSPTIAAITKADVYANGSVFWEPPVNHIWSKRLH